MKSSVSSQKENLSNTPLVGQGRQQQGQNFVFLLNLLICLSILFASLCIFAADIFPISSRVFGFNSFFLEVLFLSEEISLRLSLLLS